MRPLVRPLVRLPVRLPALLPAVVAGACLLTGCTGAGAPEPERALATPLASYDTGRAVVTRAEFCELVGPDALEEALGQVVEPETWRDGDRVVVARGQEAVQEAVQEFGCRWSAGTTTGSAWVLAPPVPLDLARRLVGEQPGAGCSRVTDAPAYGDPSRAVTCQDGTVRFAGLFGDAWLTCELGGPDVDVEAVGRWCVAVAEAASS